MISLQVDKPMAPFLADKPMAPFLADSLEKLSKSLCRKFIRKEILDGAVTTLKFTKLEIADTTNQLSVAQNDLGFTITN